MSSERPLVVAEITSEARSRCEAIGGGALEADAPPPEPGIVRIALVSPVRFAGGDGEF